MCTPHRARRTPRLRRRTPVRYHERVALPPTATRAGREPAAMGYLGNVKERRERAPCARKSYARRDRTDPGGVGVVCLPLGPRRPVHTDPAVAWAAPAPASRARSKAPPDRGAEPRR